MKKFYLVFILTITACNPSQMKSQRSIDYYEVWCKHPLGHAIKLVVDYETWTNLYSGRAGVFRFKDVKGVKHQTSAGCYTNNVAVDKQ